MALATGTAAHTAAGASRGATLPRAFTELEFAGMPEPVGRYFAAAIAPASPGPVAARLSAPDMASGLGPANAFRDVAAPKPLSYHGGRLWPHDRSSPANFALSGHGAAAMRLLGGLVEAASAFQGRLPELFGGERRAWRLRHDPASSDTTHVGAHVRSMDPPAGAHSASQALKSRQLPASFAAFGPLMGPRDQATARDERRSASRPHVDDDTRSAADDPAPSTAPQDSRTARRRWRDRS